MMGPRVFTGDMTKVSLPILHQILHGLSIFYSGKEAVVANDCTRVKNLLAQHSQPAWAIVSSRLGLTVMPCEFFENFILIYMGNLYKLVTLIIYWNSLFIYYCLFSQTDENFDSGKKPWEITLFCFQLGINILKYCLRVKTLKNKNQWMNPSSLIGLTTKATQH